MEPPLKSVFAKNTREISTTDLDELSELQVGKTGVICN